MLRGLSSPNTTARERVTASSIFLSLLEASGLATAFVSSSLRFCQSFLKASRGASQFYKKIEI